MNKKLQSSAYSILEVHCPNVKLIPGAVNDGGRTNVGSNITSTCFSEGHTFMIGVSAFMYTVNTHSCRVSINILYMYMYVACVVKYM